MMDVVHTAVISGASGGIGGATAIKLASLGYCLALLGRSSAKLKAVKKACMSINNNATVNIYPTDVTKTESIAATHKKVMEDFREIDLLVDSVGIVPVGTLLELTEADWEMAIATCLTGTVRIVSKFAKNMQKRGYGQIILINGILSIQPDPKFVVSSTITGAIKNFAKSISRDLGSYGVRVNVVNPGATKTPLLDVIIDQFSQNSSQSVRTIEAQLEDGALLGRLALPEDVANVVAFLAAKESSYINGAFIQLDGGTSLAM